MRQEDARRRTEVEGENRLGYALGAIVLVSAGMLLLAPSLMNYWHLTDTQRDLREQAERQGVGEIPGVNIDEEITLALALALAGGVLSAIGAALVPIGMLRSARGSGAGK